MSRRLRACRPIALRFRLIALRARLRVTYCVLRTTYCVLATGYYLLLTGAHGSEYLEYIADDRHVRLQRHA